MKSRILLLACTIILCGAGLYAQETTKPKTHQFGINFNSLNSFGIHYKTGSEKTLFRVSLFTANITNSKQWGREQDSVENKQLAAGAGFRVGFEKHVPVTPGFNFLWGAEFGCNYQYDKYNYSSYYPDAETSYWTINPGVYLVLGATYTVKEHFVLGAEITPGIWDTFGKQTIKSNGEVMKQTSSNALGFGFNTGSANLSLAYRF